MEKCIEPPPFLLAPRRPDVVVRALHTNWQSGLKLNLTIKRTASTQPSVWEVHGRNRTYNISQSDMKWECTCHTSRRTSIPCVHVFAVLHHEQLDFGAIDLNDHHFTIDADCVSCCGCLELMTDRTTQSTEVTNHLENANLVPQVQHRVFDEHDPDLLHLHATDSATSTFMQIRSGLYNAESSSTSQLQLTRCVLLGIEKYISVGPTEEAPLTENVRSEALACASRLADSLSLSATPEKEIKLKHCQSLLDGLLSTIHALIPTMQSPMKVKPSRRSKLIHSPEETFPKTSKQHHTDGRRKRKIPITLSQQLRRFQETDLTLETHE